MKARKVCVEMSAALLEFIGRLRGPDGERYTPKELLETLVEDLRLADARPGSWEGANMLEVLRGHGIREVWED